MDSMATNTTEELRKAGCLLQYICALCMFFLENKHISYKDPVAYGKCKDL